MVLPDIYVSNGTCYFAPGLESGPEFLPCGNDYYGHKPCCQAGDLCLGNNACFNHQFGVTYLAGCSDLTYGDASCPDKDSFTENPWVGLVYCNGTSDEWVVCDQAAQPTTLTKPDTCWCPETSRTVAFAAASELSYEASLPTSAGQSLGWQAGYVPTAPPTPSAPPSSSSASGSGASSSFDTATFSPIISTVTVVQSAPPSDTSSSSSSSGDTSTTASPALTSGAKIGIGIGVCAFAIAVLGLLAALFLKRRRDARRRDLEGPDGSGEGAHGVGGPIDGAGYRDAKNPLSQSTPSELEPRAARPWSLRSELAAQGENVHTSVVSELAGSDGWGPSWIVVTPGAGMQNTTAAHGTAAAVTNASPQSYGSANGTTAPVSPEVPSPFATPNLGSGHENGSGDAAAAAGEERQLRLTVLATALRNP